MGSFGNAFSSSIGKKLTVGITGLFLISFLLIHVSINATIFFNDGGETFNTAAHFMSHNPVIRVLEIGLFVGLILHIVQSLMLTYQNQKARPVAYAKFDGQANSKWYSRSMGILGSLLLIFLVVHLANFWVPTKVALFTQKDHNLFQNMQVIFKSWYYVALYVLGVAALAYHLLHGFSSAFQTLGWNHKKYTPIINKIGFWFSILIPLLFASMPIAMYFNLIN